MISFQIFSQTKRFYTQSILSSSAKHEQNSRRPTNPQFSLMMRETGVISSLSDV